MIQKNRLKRERMKKIKSLTLDTTVKCTKDNNLLRVVANRRISCDVFRRGKFYFSNGLVNYKTKSFASKINCNVSVFNTKKFDKRL